MVIHGSVRSSLKLKSAVLESSVLTAVLWSVLTIALFRLGDSTWDGVVDGAAVRGESLM